MLWEITFTNDVVDLADLSVNNAAAFAIYPALMLNPSQDYDGAEGAFRLKVTTG